MSQNMCSWKAPLVTLADGRQVPSDSREWLEECEARYILNQPTKAARHELLNLVEKQRGVAARNALQDRIMNLWRLTRRGNAA